MLSVLSELNAVRSQEPMARTPSRERLFGEAAGQPLGLPENSPWRPRFSAFLSHRSA